MLDIFSNFLAVADPNILYWTLIIVIREQILFVYCDKKIEIMYINICCLLNLGQH